MHPRSASPSKPRTNNQIRVPQVRVIGPEGANLGILDTAKAISLAKTHGLDLVEMSGTSQPPVCKICDLGKYLYDLSKADKSKQAHAAPRLKEVQLSVNIGEHDFETKMRHAREFLLDQHPVKLLLTFHGREQSHPEFGFAVVNKAVEHLKDCSKVSTQAKRFGRQITAFLQPAKHTITVSVPAGLGKAGVKPSPALQVA